MTEPKSTQESSTNLSRDIETQDVTRRDWAKVLGALVGVGALTAGCEGQEQPASDLIGQQAIASVSPGTTPIKWVDTVKFDLATLTNGATAIGADVVVAKNFSTLGDGGGGVFVWSTKLPDGSAVTSSPTQGNNGTIVFPTGQISNYGVWLRLYSGPVNIRWFGAAPEASASVNTTAVAAAIVAATKTTNAVPKHMYVPAGTYIVDKIVGITSYFLVTGDGLYNSVLQSHAGDTVIEITGAQNLQMVSFRDICIRGNGGQGHGIYIHDNLPLINGHPSAIAEVTLRDVRVENTGGKGVYILDEFSSTLENVSTDSTAGNAFEVQGGNTTRFDRCYVHNLPTAGTCAYRIYDGSPTFVGCNGVNSVAANVDWGVFGRNVPEDGIVSYSKPTFIGCNVEAFTRYGIRFKNGSWGNFLGTTFVASASNVSGLLFDYVSGDNPGVWDGASGFGLSNGTWKNGLPVHVTLGGPPFIPTYDANLASFYNDTSNAAFSFPRIGTDYTYLKFGVRINRLKVDEAVKIGSNTVTFGTTPPTTDTWKQGDITWNSGAASGSNAGWVCTVSGTPGVWKAFGAIA